MDVSISVSLLRDQLGCVIEQAVTAAVETVLGEMVRVVGSKFEELRREMSIREKETENIRQMLEVSRCQMKNMRKYLSTLNASQAKICPQLPPSKTQVTFNKANSQSLGAEKHSTGSPDTAAWHNLASKSPVLQNEVEDSPYVPTEGTLREEEVKDTRDLRDHKPSENPPHSSNWMKVHHSQSREPTPSPTQHSLVPGLACEEPPDVKVMHIKEEPVELETCPQVEDGEQENLPVWEEQTEEMTVNSSTYLLTQSPPLDAQKQVFGSSWLNEEYRCRKAEVKRRSQSRRRELEKSLPQPLLAALVRERREKTRLRVARWRAKRKLQAQLYGELSAQASQANGSSGDSLSLTQQQQEALSQYGRLVYGGPHCDSAAHCSNLQFGSFQLLPALRSSIVNAGLASGVSSTTQQGLFDSDCDVFQNSMT